MIEFVCKFVRYPAAVRSRRFLQKYEKFKRRYSSYRPLRWTILYFVKRSLRLFFVLNSFGSDASLNMWYKITQSYLLLNPQFKFHAIPTLCWILQTSAKMETFGVKFKPTLHLIFVGAFMFEQTKCLIISSKIVFDKCLLWRMFVRLITNVGTRKNVWVPTRNQTSDSALGYSTTEPQRLFGKLDSLTHVQHIARSTKQTYLKVIRW